MKKNKIKDESYKWNFVSAILFIILIIILILISNIINTVSAPSPFQFFLMSLATFRLIHLLYMDMVMDFVRDYFNEYKTGPKNTIRKLLGCPWCIGIWMALFIGYLYYLIPYSIIFITILAIAGLGTFLEILTSLIMKK